MIFDEGTTIFRNGERYQIGVRKDNYAYLDHSSNDSTIKVSINTLVDEYMIGTVHIDGYDSPQNQQAALTEKHWARIHYRKFFAFAFSRKSTTRVNVHKKIRRIGRLMNLPPQNLPSRASCYRWAKLLRDAHGDITVLR